MRFARSETRCRVSKPHYAVCIETRPTMRKCGCSLGARCEITEMHNPSNMADEELELAGGAGSGLGAVMSLVWTIRPLEQATTRSRVGWASRSFTTAAFTVLVRAGAGSRPNRRRHALGASDVSLHIALSFENTRCLRSLSPSNETVATSPYSSEMVARFPEAPISFSTRKAGLSDG